MGRLLRSAPVAPRHRLRHISFESWELMESSGGSVVGDTSRAKRLPCRKKTVAAARTLFEDVSKSTI